VGPSLGRVDVPAEGYPDQRTAAEQRSDGDSGGAPHTVLTSCGRRPQPRHGNSHGRRRRRYFRRWRELAIAPAFISNDGASLIAMAFRHRGLVLLSEWGLKDSLRRGELVEVTLDQPVSVGRGGEAGIYMLYLQTRYRIPKARVAVEFLLERLGEPNGG
jgi:DNA-binding transcriptional LysR family regulator